MLAEAGIEDFLDGTQDDVGNTQPMEVSADGTTYLFGPEFSVRSFFNETYCCDIVDPVGEFVTNVTSEIASTKSDCFNDNLFHLVCAVAYSCNSDGVGLVTKGPMRTEDQWISLVLSFQSLIHTMPQQEYWMENLFNYLPEKSFPSQFVAGFVDKKKTKSRRRLLSADTIWRIIQKDRPKG